MTTAPSLWTFIAHADPVVKTVMFLLLGASVVAWAMIFQRIKMFKKAKKSFKAFEVQFWSGGNLSDLYDECAVRESELTGIETVFFNGYREFKRLSQRPGQEPTALLNGAERAMQIANAKEFSKLEKNLGFLATVGSTSPYVGLFGTVWGIMVALQALGAVQQASISMVAPGISEALIATAMGLFVAIPAVIANNRFNSQVACLENDYEIFQDEFSNILHREAHLR